MAELYANLFTKKTVPWIFAAVPHEQQQAKDVCSMAGVRLPKKAPSGTGSAFCCSCRGDALRGGSIVQFHLKQGFPHFFHFVLCVYQVVHGIGDSGRHAQKPCGLRYCIAFRLGVVKIGT